MRVYTFQAYGPALLADDKLDIPSGPRIGWNDAIPNRGYWKVGDRVYSLDPLNPNLAWACVAEGNPGTWEIASGGATGPEIVGAIRAQIDGVNPDLILAGLNVLSITRTAPGWYRIVFDAPSVDNNVSDHVVVASVVSGNDCTIRADLTRNGTNVEVIIYIFNGGGGLTDQVFSAVLTKIA